MAADGGLEMLWQTMTVDLQPTSRWTKGATDTANVETSVHLPSATDEGRLRELFPDFDVELREQTALLRARIPVEGSDDRFRFLLSAPPAGATLLKNGDLSVVVMLPRPGVYATGPVYEVELVEWPHDPEPVIFGVGAVPAVAGRITLAWYTRQDPDDPIDYIYRKIRD